MVKKFTQKGYAQVAPENADFLVSYHIVVTQEIDKMAVQEQSAVTVFENSNINLDETYTIVYPDRTVGGSRESPCFFALRLSTIPVIKPLSSR